MRTEHHRTPASRDAADIPVALRLHAEEDIPALTEILRELWHTGVPDEDAAREEAASDLFGCLARSTGALVADVEGALQGICCIRVPGAPPLAKRWDTKLHTANARLAELDPSAARAWDAWCRGCAHVNGSLIAEAHMDTAAEIVLLALSAGARGRGAGRALIDRARELLAAQGACDAYLLTDTDCSWGFYEHLGFPRLAEHARTTKDEPSIPESMFLYRVPLAL